MSSIPVESTETAGSPIDLSAPSPTMRALIASEAERWRQMDQASKDAANASLTGRLRQGFVALLRPPATETVSFGQTAPAAAGVAAAPQIRRWIVP
jgi:hypothetical protein